MPDPQSRIARYHASANECMKLAALQAQEDLRLQYIQLAEAYLQLVQLELEKLPAK